MRDSVQSIGDPKEPTSKVATHVEFTREPSGLYSRGMDRAETDGLREAVNRHGRDHPRPRVQYIIIIVADPVRIVLRPGIMPEMR